MRLKIISAVFALILVACSPEIVLKPTPTSTETVQPAIIQPTKEYIPTTTIVAEEVVKDTYCVIVTGLENGNVYMRSGPDKSFKIVRVLNEGEEVTLLDEVDGWFLIEFDGNYGYIGSSLCYVKE